MLRTVTILFLLFGIWFCGFSDHINDTVPLQRKFALNIYLDCIECDNEYFKSSFRIVNYTRDPGDADVHILVSSIGTGSGGEEFNIVLKGQGRFKSMIDTVIFSFPADMTSEEERSALLEKIKLALVPYLLKTPLGNRMSLYIDGYEVIVNDNVKDPWRNWMFDISLLGFIHGEKSGKTLSLTNSLYVSKITPKIKIESISQIQYEVSKMSLYQDNALIYSSTTWQRHLSSKNLFVKSLGHHGGIGGRASFLNSNYRNIDFQMRVGPAIEGNLFKYADASRKQLRLIYSLMYEHSRYTDSTIFNKISDYLFRNELNLIFMYNGSWGHINASLNANSYLNNFSLCSLGTRTNTSFRLYKGLSLNMIFDLKMHRDQIALKKESITPEQFIMSQREMQTNYLYQLMIGLSLRFGSKYNNTVNPRFN